MSVYAYTLYLVENNEVHSVRFALISELFASRKHKVIVKGSKIENLIRNLRLKTQPDEGSATHNYTRIRSLQVHHKIEFIEKTMTRVHKWILAKVDQLTHSLPNKYSHRS